MCGDEYGDWSRFRDEECTCFHDPEEHGWVRCDEPDCPCQAAWEE